MSSYYPTVFIPFGVSISLVETMQTQFLEGMNNTHVCDKVLHVLGDHALMLEEWEKHAK